MQASLLRFGHYAFEHTDAGGKCAQETLFLLLHHAAYQHLLRLQFRISLAHFLNQRRYEFAEEGFALSEEGVGIAYGAAQDAADDIACLGVGGKLAIGDGEGDGPQVVRNDAHGHIHLLVLAVREAREFPYAADDGLENVRVVVRLLALDGTHQAFKAHTRVNHVHGERFERAVRLAVELHEHDVPDFDNLRVVLVHQFVARLLGLFFRRAAVEVNFRARSAGAGVAHFPEVVVFVAVDDMVGRQVLGPNLGRFVVASQPFFFRTFKHGGIEVGRVQLQHVDEVLPCHVDGPFLEVVAEAPVAEHFKHGVVIRVVSHLFQIVMFTADTQALLRVRPSARLRVALSQDDIFPLIHSGVGKHQCGVVLDNHRCRGHDGMALCFKKLLVRVSDFVSSHHIFDCYLHFGCKVSARREQ